MNRAIAVIKRILRDIEKKHLQVVAAGVAFYFAMSLVPALVLLTVVMAYLPLQDGTQTVTSFMSHLTPPQGVLLIEQMLTTISPHRTGLLSFAIVTTLWLTSKGVKAVISALDIVYEVRVPRPLWVNRILAFGLTFAVGVLLLLGVVLTLAGPVLETLLSASAPVQSLWMKVWPYVQWSLSAIFTFAGIELLYLFAPNLPATNRLTIPGALVAASAWLALSWGLGFYFHHFGDLKLDRIYGILATPIALMIWLRWNATVILNAAEINVFLQSRKSVSVSHPEETQHQMDAA